MSASQEQSAAQPPMLRERLREAESQMKTLQEEIRALRYSLMEADPESLPSTKPRFQRDHIEDIEDLKLRGGPRATQSSMALPLFQVDPESLIENREHFPKRPSQHSPSSQSMRGAGSPEPISATFGSPLPPGVMSPAPPIAPPMLFEPEELSPRQHAIAQYHQEPFFVDTSFVSKLTPDELDDLPYGVIQLDTKGRILAYNDTEARLAGYPKDRVIGRNFFAIAPCTRVREFQGRFEDLATGKTFSLETFEFVFNFRKGSQRVLIMIFPASRRRGVFNIAIIRK